MAPEKKVRKRTTDEERELLVEYVFNLGYPISRASQMLNIKVRTAYGVIGHFLKEHRTTAKKGSGRPKKFDDKFEQSLESFIEAKPDATLMDLQQQVQSKLGITVSLSSINRVITRRGIYRLSNRPRMADLVRRYKAANPGLNFQFGSAKSGPSAVDEPDEDDWISAYELDETL